jgi:hypothetical protein
MLIGIQLYAADAVVTRRQEYAVDALSTLAGVEALNLQFKNGPRADSPKIETAAVLEGDSVAVTGAPGKRKPLAREVFDALADRAARRGHRHFAFINADIVVKREAVEEIDRRACENYVISRSDVDDLGNDIPHARPMTSGLDMFVVSTAWWPRHRHRFRQYIIGETCWDCVYAAILLSHSRGIVLNRDTLMLHERHAPSWHEVTPAARYNGMLAALDARYFSIWAQYWERLEELRARGGPAEEEQELQRRAFVWRPSPYQAARQAVRSLRARRVYKRTRAQWTERRA